MISRRIVFLLGAGASVPFQFPTGRGLMDGVINALAREKIKKSFEEYGFRSEDLDAFRDSLRHSGRNSVDAFLEHRQEFVELGKTAIAYSLIQRETDDDLFARPAENWLLYIYERMNCPFEKFGENKVSFVTFNYDRTVEHFLFTSLKNSYGKSDEECAKQLERIPVIHLHGHMGNLPWQGANGRPFEPRLTADTVAVAKRGIKIIHDQVDADRDRDFDTAKRLLAEAEQIYVLGFGFAPANVERLGLHDLAGKLFKATAPHLTSLERDEIRNRVNVELEITSYDCIQLLRNRAVW